MRIVGVIGLLVALVSSNGFAADANGYTARYECRAGGLHCNVDVEGLAGPGSSCDQIIDERTSWSAINWSNNTICVEAGDHTWKGTLTIPATANGSSGNYKILRYYRSGDTNDEPWNQSAANRATLRNIEIQGSFWITHRLSFEGAETVAPVLFPPTTGGSNNILNRILVERSGGAASVNIRGDNSDNNTLQNSVLRNPKIAAGTEVNGVDLTPGNTGGGPDGTHIVNNEIYNHNQEFGIEDGSCSTNATVLENNDLYRTSALLTNCSGTFTPGDPDSPCQAAEGIISNKCGAQSGTVNTTRYIHNRLWQTRKADTNVCCLGGANGHAMSISTAGDNPADNILFQNNIVMDSQSGLRSIRPTHNNISIIGNIFYRIKIYNAALSSNALDIGSNSNAVEVYLNTVIKADEHWGSLNATNSDWRCNVYVDAGTPTGSIGSGSQHDSNAFYGTASFTTSSTSEQANIDVTLRTRASSTAYNVGEIIRTSATPITDCIRGTESACFLYKVIQAGVSSNSVANYCTTLGCTVADGGITVQAIRGPYTYRRKLRTVLGGEPMTIPYALPYGDPNNIQASAPEAYACPPNFSARQGVGIN